MKKYDLYEKVMLAMKEDESTFNAAARNWVEGAETADFGNEEANNLFYDAKMHCKAWRNKAINGRVSKQKMIDCIRKIAEMELPNPYDPNEIDQEEILAQNETKQEEIKQEPMHILGVLPEEEIEIEVPDIQIPEEELVEEKNIEKPAEKEHLFNRRKKR